MSSRSPRPRGAKPVYAAPDMRIHLSDAGKKAAPIRFGSVTLSAAEPSAASVERNIQQGQDALARMAKKLVQPGIALTVPKNVPLFHADEGDPRLLVRTLNGRVQRGKLKDGVFEAIEE